MNFGTALPSSVLWVFSKWWQLSCQQMDRPNIEKQFIFLGITITRVKTFILALFVNGYLNGSKKWRHNIYKSLCTFILRVPWTVRRSNQAIWKEISPEYPLEGLMLKLKLQYFGHWCEELIYWTRPWCWERLKAGGEGDDRGSESPTRWTRVWANSGSWWWTGKSGVLKFMGLQKVGHDRRDWTKRGGAMKEI